MLFTSSAWICVSLPSCRSACSGASVTHGRADRALTAEFFRHHLGRLVQMRCKTWSRHGHADHRSDCLLPAAGVCSPGCRGGRDGSDSVGGRPAGWRRDQVDRRPDALHRNDDRRRHDPGGPPRVRRRRRELDRIDGRDAAQGRLRSCAMPWDGWTRPRHRGRPAQPDRCRPAERRLRCSRRARPRPACGKRGPGQALGCLPGTTQR